ncbi:hypothetical protein GUJ93_ZPchr0013g35827 [Zizania palustris]|uniref:Uncharacterized protein n=1 Tax=Zizania palustris TaxID=103762 RepID=A0A8J5X0N8_ZIZPA|nr:hypothetical protein GUJ93_ZPchr0010g7693 [Zizania palustris]KAG8099234.1 hypothetical protein GUJ93_ZPchr0013g35827 [Zizania palustris]
MSSCDGDGEEVSAHHKKSLRVGSLDDVDLEAGLAKVIKASLEKVEKNCGIFACDCSSAPLSWLDFLID